MERFLTRDNTHLSRLTIEVAEGLDTAPSDGLTSLIEVNLVQLIA